MSNWYYRYHYQCVLLFQAAATLGALTGCGQNVTGVSHPGMSGGAPGSLPDGALGITPDVVLPPAHSEQPVNSNLDFSKCPKMPPVLGTNCSIEGLYCTYGDSVRADCRTRFECWKSQWKPGKQCKEVPADYCPPNPGQGSCMMVSSFARWNASGTCGYPDGTMCTCEDCPNKLCQKEPGWECIAPPTTNGCPRIIPNVGVPCEQQGLTCLYGDSCRGGGIVICRLGAWFPTGDGRGCSE